MNDDTTAQAAPPPDSPAPDAYAQAANADLVALRERARSAGYTVLLTGSAIALHKPACSIFAGSVIEAHLRLDDEGVRRECAP